VDYALIFEHLLLAAEGMSLSEAYYRALTFTGKVVHRPHTPVGVATWTFRPSNFRLIGILLCFMFLWNMVGV
jgi:hypothetical protein